MIRKKKTPKKSESQRETVESIPKDIREEVTLEAEDADDDQRKIVLDMSEDEDSEEVDLPAPAKGRKPAVKAEQAHEGKEKNIVDSSVLSAADEESDIDAVEDLDDVEFDSEELVSESLETSDSSSGALLEELMSLQTKVEAILFASPKPIKPSEIEEWIADERISTRDIIHVIDQLLEFYETRGGGFKLEYLKNLGYQFRTIPAASPIMERMFSSRPRPLSRAAMETLAIVAYRQPVARAEIEFIRGVDAGSILKNLLERELVKCVGRKADAGRPMLFGTSDEFLRVFRLSGLEELPSLDSFQTDPSLIQAAMEKLDSEQAVSIEGFIAGEGASADLEDLAADEAIEGDLEQPLTRNIQGASRVEGDDVEDEDFEDMSAIEINIPQVDAADIEDPQ